MDVTPFPSNLQENALPGYTLLDSGNFQKLEQIGPWKIIRPAAGACWRPSLDDAAWSSANLEFQRRGAQDGVWIQRKGANAKTWTIKMPPLTLELRLTDFGHIGIFPEHANQWTFISQAITEMQTKLNQAPKVLNLFAYTGAFSLFAAQQKAEVVHVDASKTSVDWAKVNARHSGLVEAPIRWMVDDVVKFCKREVRRGSQYQVIILDPPSFGRGPKGELWKIEDHLNELLDDLKALLDPQAHALLLSCHTPGYTPLALENILAQVFPDSKPESGELATIGKTLSLPSGCFARIRKGWGS